VWLVACIIILTLVPHPIAITVAALGIVFVAPFIYFFFRRWSARLPAVTMTPEGINDSAWAMSAGFVYWDEVIDCAIIRYAFTDWLVFRITDTQSMLRRIPLHKRIIIRISRLLLPSPFMIPGSIIEVSSHELLEEVRLYYTKYVAKTEHDEI